MKICRMLLVLATLVMAVTVVQPAAQAAVALDPLVVDMDPVSFWIFDTGVNSSVTLSATTFDSEALGSLQYSYDAIDWTPFYGPASINIGDIFSGAAVINTGNIFFKLGDDNDGVATFQSYDGSNSAGFGVDLYGGLLILWNESPTSFTFFTTNSTGRFAQTPIPASAILLVTGLIGLIGFRVRLAKK